MTILTHTPIFKNHPFGTDIMIRVHAYDESAQDGAKHYVEVWMPGVTEPLIIPSESNAITIKVQHTTEGAVITSYREANARPD